MIRIFISHIHEEVEIAKALKEALDSIFAKQVEVFLAEEIPLGTNWFSEIRTNLKAADLILALFSPYSANRPWVNIEAGFGIMSDKPVIPLLCYGLRKDRLPAPYHFQQFVVLTEKKDLSKLVQQIAYDTPAGRLLVERDIAAKKIYDIVQKALMTSAPCKPHLDEPPTVWIIGSHRALDDRQQVTAIHTVSAIAREFVKREFRIVMGVSRLLEYLGDRLTDEIEKDAKTLANASSEPFRKSIGQVSAEENYHHPSPNPVILLGSLRSSKGVKRIFLDSISRVPDVALVFGGRAECGRTLEEVSLAKEAGIPVLPIKFLGGASAVLPHTFDDSLSDKIEKLEACLGHVGEIGPKMADIVEKQTLIARNYQMGMEH
jgi:TIR domain-containing protein